MSDFSSILNFPSFAPPPFFFVPSPLLQDELEAELDALGDDLLLDDDTSFLDDAVTAPSIPTSEPGGESSKAQDGVLLDEFGLPQIPAK